MPTFGEWTFTVDRDATVLAYGRAGIGGVDSCNCVHCRNFRLARDQVFPEQFVLLLDKLGIDPHKDGEVYHNARIVSRVHDYAGWFHFVGTLHSTGDCPAVEFNDAFSAWLCVAMAPRLATLENLPAVQLEFRATAVPWLLDEPDPP